MSETKKYTGLIRKSELTVEQVVEKIVDESGHTASMDWYDSHEEFINCEGDDKWIVINGVVYESELKEEDPYSDNVRVVEVGEGEYQVDTTFYNGGTCLLEMLEVGFDLLKEEKKNEETV